MNWIKNIKIAIADYLFRKEIKFLKRKRMVMNFADAKKIGVLFDAKKEGVYEPVKQFVVQVRNRQKDIRALGFYDGKELPQHFYVKFGIDFFTRKQLNWLYFPNHHVISNFMNEDFDILINFDTGQSFPLEYISTVSKAKFRVGKYAPGNELYYDFMIDLKPGSSIKDFISQADHFLNQINQPHA